MSNTNLAGGIDSSPIDKNWDVTNKTQKPLTAISAFDSSTTGSMKYIYELPLSYLKTGSGSKELPGGKQSQVVLDGTNADGSYRIIYDVVFAKPDNGFPVDNKSILLPLTANTYTPYEIPDTATMQHTYNFFRLIQAYPASKLAQNFNDAVQKEQENGTLTTPSSTNPVDAFFKSTKQYTDCTSVSYATVLSYNQTFAGSSIGFSNSFTFYIYQTGSNKVSEAGTVTFTLSDAKNPFDLNNSNGGYTITFTDASGKTTNLTYNQGQFVSDVQSDLPSICLGISWVSKNQLNSTSDSPDTIMPMIAGYASGSKVCGTSVKQDGGDGSSSSWHWPNTFMGWYQFVLTVFGGIFVLDFIYQKTWGKRKARQAEERAQGDKQISEDQNRALNEKLDGLSQKIEKVNQDAMNKLQSDIKFNSDIKVVNQNARSVVADVGASKQQAVMEKQVAEYGDQLDALAEYGVTEQMAEDATKLREASTDIMNAKTPEELKTAKEKWDPEVQNIKENLAKQAENLGDRLSEETKAKIDESNKNLEELDEQQQELEKEEKVNEEGEHSEENKFEGEE